MGAFAFMPAGRVAPIRGSVWRWCVGVVFGGRVWCCKESQARMGATRPASGMKAKTHRQACN